MHPCRHCHMDSPSRADKAIPRKQRTPASSASQAPSYLATMQDPIVLLQSYEHMSALCAKNNSHEVAVGTASGSAMVIDVRMPGMMSIQHLSPGNNEPVVQLHWQVNAYNTYEHVKRAKAGGAGAGAASQPQRPGQAQGAYSYAGKPASVAGMATEATPLQRDGLLVSSCTCGTGRDAADDCCDGWCTDVSWPGHVAHKPQAMQVLPLTSTANPRLLLGCPCNWHGSQESAVATATHVQHTRYSNHCNVHIALLSLRTLPHRYTCLPCSQSTGLLPGLSPEDSQGSQSQAEPGPTGPTPTSHQGGIMETPGPGLFVQRSTSQAEQAELQRRLSFGNALPGAPRLAGAAGGAAGLLVYLQLLMPPVASGWSMLPWCSVMKAAGMRCHRP
jgi:hypothetical protein